MTVNSSRIISTSYLVPSIQPSTFMLRFFFPFLDGLVLFDWQTTVFFSGLKNCCFLTPAFEKFVIQATSSVWLIGFVSFTVVFLLSSPFPCTLCLVLRNMILSCLTVFSPHSFRCECFLFVGREWNLGARSEDVRGIFWCSSLVRWIVLWWLWRQVDSWWQRPRSGDVEEYFDAKYRWDELCRGGWGG